MKANKKRGSKKRDLPRTRRELPPESRSSEALTVAWTVTLTMLLLCDLAIVAAHYYLQLHRDAQGIALLKELLLLGGSLVGVLSLLLLPAIFRVRRVPPPTGLTVFGVCLAAAPLVALLAKSLR